MRFEPVDIGLPPSAFQGRVVNNIAVDSHGTLWIAAWHGLFRRLADGRSERYTTTDGLPDNFVETIFQDHGGRWWIGTRRRGFCSLVGDPQPGRRITERCYSTADGLPGNDVRSIFQSSTGALWIGTLGGLSKFDPGGPSFRNFTAADGLSTAVIYKINEDRDRNLWIGTRDNGVMKMPDDGFVTYGMQDGFITGNADSRIFEDRNGELRVITAVGARAFIERFDGARFIATEIRLPREDPRGSVWLRPGSFQDRFGELWVATTSGLYLFSKTRRLEDLSRVRPRFIYDVTHGLQGSSLDHIYQGARGDIWIASSEYSAVENHTEHDLAQWDRATDSLRHLEPEKLSRVNNNAVTALREDASGNLWIGLDRGGLVRRRGDRFESIQSGQDASKGLIRNILVDHTGRLWIASTQGLGRIENPSAEHPQLTWYTTSAGLSSNEIRCISEDRLGRIYLGDNRGVDRLDPVAPARSSEPEKLGVKHYTWADGLAKGTVQFAFRDRAGTLWFLTNDGISHLTPGPEVAPAPPQILITGLRIMGEAQPLSQLGETRITDVELPPSRNHLDIEFLSLDFRQGIDLRYQYMLEGTDEHWGNPTDQRRVLYPRLSPGAYRFLVRAVTSDGRASSQPAIVAFTVLAPVWQRWWFIGLEAALAIMIVWGLYHYRVEKLLEVERIRTRIASDLHDDIGSSLSQVAILSEVVRQRIGQNDAQIDRPLSRIATISRELVDSMSDIVWAINPDKDRLYFLTQRMREFSSDVLMARGIQFHFGTSSPEQISVGAEMRRQVFLIFKECIHNIIRHANCTQVEIELLVEKERLIVHVRDNGAGFEPCTPVSGHGLRSMRHRAETLGGRFDVAANGQGTCVTLEVPLSQKHARSPESGGSPPE
jgi:signal transduction histidine kinase/ligand-binding sensor domain-containing protein